MVDPIEVVLVAVAVVAVVVVVVVAVVPVVGVAVGFVFALIEDEESEAYQWEVMADVVGFVVVVVGWRVDDSGFEGVVVFPERR